MVKEIAEKENIPLEKFENILSEYLYTQKLPKEQDIVDMLLIMLLLLLLLLLPLMLLLLMLLMLLLMLLLHAKNRNKQLLKFAENTFHWN